MEIVKVTTDNFDEIVMSNKKVLVDFWADWCGPCKMIAPIIDGLAEKFQDKAVIGKADADENEQLLLRFNVMMIPTVILFQNGEEADRLVGVHPAGAYEELLEKA